MTSKVTVLVPSFKILIEINDEGVGEIRPAVFLPQSNVVDGDVAGVVTAHEQFCPLDRFDFAVGNAELQSKLILASGFGFFEGDLFADPYPLTALDAAPLTAGIADDRRFPAFRSGVVIFGLFPLTKTWVRVLTPDVVCTSGRIGYAFRPQGPVQVPVMLIQAALLFNQHEAGTRMVLRPRYGPISAIINPPELPSTSTEIKE